VGAVSIVSYSELRQRLAAVMDHVCDSGTPVIVTRQNARPVVMLSLEEYESMTETLHLLRSPRNAERLLRSVAAADAGELREAEPAA
jgi:antitoxin YefM